MIADEEIFDLTYHSEDTSEALEEFVEFIANRKLLDYKGVIHYGGKAGESLWTHVMNLVTTIDKLRMVFQLTDEEMRCLFLALTIHDINKLEQYQTLPNGKPANYANAASRENIEDQLGKLKADSFWPEWKEYHIDIKYLADAHQEESQQAGMHNQKKIEQCTLKGVRLEGPLKFLMKVADVSDNSHSGDYTKPGEQHIRDKLLIHINAALNADKQPRRYRIVGHRLAEQRGLLTNIVHNEFVSYMQTTYGKEACIDLLYRPEGVDYLLDKGIPFTWTSQTQAALATNIDNKIAQIQLYHLAQFIKATPSGITVDDAAIQSGASPEELFHFILNTVICKQYRPDWREERNTLVRKDLEKFLAGSTGDTSLREQVTCLLQEKELVSVKEEVLQRGEFLIAYRNFLKEHRIDQLKAVKQDAWTRAARLFLLPETSDALYNLVDPYRRGYFMARDLPAQDIDDMREAALADLAQLRNQANAARMARQKKNRDQEEAQATDVDQEEQFSAAFDAVSIIDYLERHLEVWDSLERTVIQAQPAQNTMFRDSLRRYVHSGKASVACCYCGSALPASEWMSVQVPSSIGVQSFSNRLEGGSARDPKRNVCAVCRTQFILEKLAWQSHRDKQGNEMVTFYLHLFPYSYFTQPMLMAWWQSIQNVRNDARTALLFDTMSYFSNWKDTYTRFQEPVYIAIKGREGLGIPTLSESMSNTPVLPLILRGSNYGKQFLRALEITLLLAQWFECRILLSRFPTPLLNLANEYSGKDSANQEPVALLVESVPQSMSWLLPHNALLRKDVHTLCTKFSLLYQIASILMVADGNEEMILYDLITSASHDSLEIYTEVDRLVEKKAAFRKGPKAEYQAINLSHSIAHLVERLLREER